MRMWIGLVVVPVACACVTWAQDGPVPQSEPAQVQSVDSAPAEGPPQSQPESESAARFPVDDASDRIQSASTFTGTFVNTLKPVQFRGSGLSLSGVRFGWGGQITAERHTPVWVKLDSGSNAIQGFVAIEYQQDASQKARVVAPFSTTPGFGALVELVICVPGRLPQLKFIISDGETTQEVFASTIAAPDELTMPTVRLDGLRVLALDSDASRSTVSLLGKDLSINVQNPGGTPSLSEIRTRMFANAVVVGIAPKDLAQSWIAYESVDVIVAREADLEVASERSREAIHAWVRSGGHLILQVSNAAQTWRAVAPEGVPPQIEFGERSEAPIDVHFRAAMVQAKGDPGAGGVAGGGSGKERSGISSLAMMRVARWRDDAAPSMSSWNMGWRVRLQGAPNTAGPIVSGPLALGTLTLLGIDPARMSEVMSDSATGQTWRAIMGDVLSDALIRLHNYDAWYQYRNTSGAASYERAAIEAILDETTMARPVGPWFFIVVAVAVLLLILCVGPVGRGVLRKRGLLRSSWVVALVLTGIASLVGLLAPMLVRSGQTLASTTTVHDMICDQSGEPVVHASTTVKSLFSGKPETLVVQARGEGNGGGGGAVGRVVEQPAEGRWWRGMSSANNTDSPVSLGDPLTVVLTQPALGVMRTGMARPIAFGQWTFRAFLEQQAAWTASSSRGGRSATSADVPSLRVVIRPGNRVRIRGLDASRRVQSVWLFTHAGSARAATAPIKARSGAKWAKPDENGVLEVVVDSASLPRSPRDWLIDGTSTNNYGWSQHQPQESQERLPWFAGMLPGAAQRNHAFGSWAEQAPAADGSAWGLVVIAICDATTVPVNQGGVEPNSKQSRSNFAFEVVRMIVPIPRDALDDIERLHGVRFKDEAPAQPASPVQPVSPADNDKDEPA